MSDRWETAIDKAIREAMDKGQMQNLPGSGKPLDLNNDSNVPDDRRMAFKILQENDMAPEWIEMHKALEAAESALIEKAHRAIRTYKTALVDAERAAPHTAESYRHNARALWMQKQRELVKAAETHNKQVTGYNLKVPRGVNHRRHLNMEREIERLMNGH